MCSEAGNINVLEKIKPTKNFKIHLLGEYFSQKLDYKIYNTFVFIELL